MEERRKILVLGAYGEAGAAVAARLLKRGIFQVVCAGRNENKLARLKEVYSGIEILQLDIRDSPKLARVLAETEIVINCVGPYVGVGAAIAKAAIQANVVYIDLATEQEHYRQLLQLNDFSKEKRVLVMTGVGAYPGLSGIMLKALLAKNPKAVSARIALATGPHSESGAGYAQEVSGVIELAFEHASLQGGKHQTVMPGKTRHFRFPAPFEETKVMGWPQMEVLAPPKGLSEFETFVSLAGGPLPSRIGLRFLKFLRPEPGSLALSFAKLLLSFKGRRRPDLDDDPTTNRGALVVELCSNGKVKRASAIVENSSLATAWLPVYAAEQWAAGHLVASGVKIPMEVFNPGETLAAVRNDEDGQGIKMDGV